MEESLVDDRDVTETEADAGPISGQPCELLDEYGADTPGTFMMSY